ncbi:uncharacterized protein LOC142587221 [Dermacentor variabilis]|uniref:uncharacterized protein LOC142587221 n=1 Tax=Dermacentor variabilis TaxID=34621 RepID=UPI003F5AE06F
MQTKPTLGNFQLPSQQQPVASHEEELKETPENMTQSGPVDIPEALKFKGEEDKSVVTGVSLPSLAAPAPSLHASSVAAISTLSVCRKREGQATPASKRRKRNHDNVLVQQLGPRMSSALEVTPLIDDLELFAMLLVRLMRLVSVDKQMDLRIEMLRTIEKYMD